MEVYILTITLANNKVSYFFNKVVLKNEPNFRSINKGSMTERIMMTSPELPKNPIKEKFTQVNQMSAHVSEDKNL